MFKIKLSKTAAHRLNILIVAGVVASLASASVALSSANQYKSKHKQAAHVAQKPVKQATATQNTAERYADKVFQQCKRQVIVVAHSGTAAEGGNSKFDVDTVRWIDSQIARGHDRIELDEQVSQDGHGFAFHDRTLNGETKNGSGVVHTKGIRYLKSRNSNHGDRFATSDDLVHILKQHHGISFQHEFKDYDNQWTPQYLEAWYAQFAGAGVLNQIHVSSASPRVLSWFHTNHPDVRDLQLIGFGDYLPDLSTAISSGATQVNASGAALNHYQGHASYLSAAQARGLKTSIRSKPNGNGDNGQTWLRAVKFGVDQIVTQGPNKAEVCNAVRKAAN